MSNKTIITKIKPKLKKCINYLQLSQCDDFNVPDKLYSNLHFLGFPWWIYWAESRDQFSNGAKMYLLCRKFHLFFCQLKGLLLSRHSQGRLLFRWAFKKKIFFIPSTALPWAVLQQHLTKCLVQFYSKRLQSLLIQYNRKKILDLELKEVILIIRCIHLCADSYMCLNVCFLTERTF